MSCDIDSVTYSPLFSSQGVDYFSMYLLNATSLAKPHAIQLLTTELQQLRCDCALITESWFTKNHLDPILSITDYTLYRRDRQKGKGGGVCAYMHNNISCSVFVPDCDIHSRPVKVEILWLECFYKGNRYFLACCYHPPKPKYDVSVFVDLLYRDIDYINGMQHNAIIIIAGNFNQLSTTFLERDHGLVQMVNSPTHCGHIIDKVFVSRPDLYNVHRLQEYLKN